MSPGLRFLAAAAAALAALGAQAEAEGTCPGQPGLPELLDPLYEALAQSRSELEARRIDARVWQIRLTAPDAEAQRLLDSGMARLRVADYETAAATFATLVDYCPDYAEGYNQRAFASFLMGEFEAALPDLDRTLELAPRHTGALTGLGLTLIGMGRRAEGEDAIRRALELNPWLSERHLLTEPPGTEL